MASQRTLRSTCSTSTVLATPPLTHSQTFKQAPKHDTPPTLHTKKDNSTTTARMSNSSSGPEDEDDSQTDNKDEEDESNEKDEKEDDDVPDVSAPSSTLRENFQTLNFESQPIQQNARSWTGPPETPTKGDTQQFNSTLDTPDTLDNTRNETECFNDNDATKFSDASSNSDFDIPDDDDDYDDVENVSVNSDNSRQFEAEVEREFREAGEEGIDWDDNIDWNDERTYEFDDSWHVELYGNHEQETLKLLRDFDRTSGGYAADLRLTHPDPILLEDTSVTSPTPVPNHWGSLTISTIASDSSRDASSIGDNSPEMIDNQASNYLSRCHSINDDGDTTDEEDFTLPHVSPKSLSNARQTRGAATKKPHPKIITPGAPPRRNVKKPEWRIVKADPNRAAAYSTTGPLGGTKVEFLPPKSRRSRWIDLSSSRDSSAVSSPTMINLDEAHMDGNTRTGAHITDVIHGKIFSNFHCNRLQSHFNPVPILSGSYQPLLEDGILFDGDIAHNGDSSLLVLGDDVAHSFIDYSGGAEDSSKPEDIYSRMSELPAPNSSRDVPVEDETLPLTVQKETEDVTMGDSVPSPYKSNLNNDVFSSPYTPEGRPSIGPLSGQMANDLYLTTSSDSLEAGTPPDNLTSPKKRRLSEHSSSESPLSPLKKTRTEPLSAVLE